MQEEPNTDTDASPALANGHAQAEDGPLSVKDWLSFQPREDGPTYTLRPIRQRQKMQLQRQIGAAGLRNPTNRECFAALSAGIADVLVDDATPEEITQARERLKACERAMAAGRPLDPFTPPELDDDRDLTDAERLLEARCAVLVQAGERYLTAFRLLRMDKLAFAGEYLRHVVSFVVEGWDRDPGLCRGPSGLTPGAYDLIPGEDLRALFWRAQDLIRLGEDARKNS